MSGNEELHAQVAASFPDFDKIRHCVLERNADPNYPDPNSNMQTCLHKAVLRKNSSLVETLLPLGALVSAKDGHGFTPLIATAWLQYSPPELLEGNRVMQILLEYDNREECVNAQDNWGMTALHNAAKNSHHHMVELLLSQGRANVNIMDKNGNLAVRYTENQMIRGLLAPAGSQVPAPGTSIPGHQPQQQPQQYLQHPQQQQWGSPHGSTASGGVGGSQHLGGSHRSSGFGSPAGPGPRGASPMPAPSGEWDCEVCTFKNPMDAGPVCSVCDAPRPPGAGASSPLNVGPPPGGQGLGGRITTSEEQDLSADLIAFHAAGEANPRQSPVPVMGQLQPPSAGPGGPEWQCTNCPLLNPSELLKCDACEAPRPGAPGSSPQQQALAVEAQHRALDAARERRASQRMEQDEIQRQLREAEQASRDVQAEQQRQEAYALKRKVEEQDRLLASEKEEKERILRAKDAAEARAVDNSALNRQVAQLADEKAREAAQAQKRLEELQRLEREKNEAEQRARDASALKQEHRQLEDAVAKEKEEHEKAKLVMMREIEKLKVEAAKKEVAELAEQRRMKQELEKLRKEKEERDKTAEKLKKQVSELTALADKSKKESTDKQKELEKKLKEEKEKMKTNTDKEKAAIRKEIETLQKEKQVAVEREKVQLSILNKKVSELSSENQHLKADNESGHPTCCVCIDKPADLAVVPCGHQCLCSTCLPLITASPKKECPFCTSPYEQIIKVFTNI